MNYLMSYRINDEPHVPLEVYEFIKDVKENKKDSIIFLPENRSKLIRCISCSTEFVDLIRYTSSNDMPYIYLTDSEVKEILHLTRFDIIFWKGLFTDEHEPESFYNKSFNLGDVIKYIDTYRKNDIVAVRYIISTLFYAFGYLAHQIFSNPEFINYMNYIHFFEEPVSYSAYFKTWKKTDSEGLLLIKLYAECSSIIGSDNGYFLNFSETNLLIDALITNKDLLDFCLKHDKKVGRYSYNNFFEFYGKKFNYEPYDYFLENLPRGSFLERLLKEHRVIFDLLLHDRVSEYYKENIISIIKNDIKLQKIIVNKLIFTAKIKKSKLFQNIKKSTNRTSQYPIIPWFISRAFNSAGDSAEFQRKVREFSYTSPCRDYFLKDSTFEGVLNTGVWNWLKQLPLVKDAFDTNPIVRDYVIHVLVGRYDFNPDNLPDVIDYMKNPNIKDSEKMNVVMKAAGSEDPEDFKFKSVYDFFNKYKLGGEFVYKNKNAMTLICANDKFRDQFMNRCGTFKHVLYAFDALLRTNYAKDVTITNIDILTSKIDFINRIEKNTTAFRLLWAINDVDWEHNLGPMLDKINYRISFIHKVIDNLDVCWQIYGKRDYWYHGDLDISSLCYQSPTHDKMFKKILNMDLGGSTVILKDEYIPHILKNEDTLKLFFNCLRFHKYFTGGGAEILEYLNAINDDSENIFIKKLLKQDIQIIDSILSNMVRLDGTKLPNDPTELSKVIIKKNIFSEAFDKSYASINDVYEDMIYIIESLADTTHEKFILRINIILTTSQSNSDYIDKYISLKHHVPFSEVNENYSNHKYDELFMNFIDSVIFKNLLKYTRKIHGYDSDSKYNMYYSRVFYHFFYNIGMGTQRAAYLKILKVALDIHESDMTIEKIFENEIYVNKFLEFPFLFHDLIDIDLMREYKLIIIKSLVKLAVPEYDTSTIQLTTNIMDIDGVVSYMLKNENFFNFMYHTSFIKDFVCGDNGINLSPSVLKEFYNKRDFAYIITQLRHNYPTGGVYTTNNWDLNKYSDQCIAENSMYDSISASAGTRPYFTPTEKMGNSYKPLIMITMIFADNPPTDLTGTIELFVLGGCICSISVKPESIGGKKWEYSYYINKKHKQYKHKIVTYGSCYFQNHIPPELQMCMFGGIAFDFSK